MNFMFICSVRETFVCLSVWFLQFWLAEIILQQIWSLWLFHNSLVAVVTEIKQFILVDLNMHLTKMLRDRVEI